MKLKEIPSRKNEARKSAFPVALDEYSHHKKSSATLHASINQKMSALPSPSSSFYFSAEATEYGKAPNTKVTQPF